jgi:hypothetical protein
MPTIPDFTTTAVITGSTLVSQADDQFNIMMDDVKNYVQNSMDIIVSEVQANAANVYTKAQTDALLLAINNRLTSLENA